MYLDDADRYSRLRLIAWWDQTRLARARILVVGAGALGNEVLKNLALVGAGTLHVVDFDKVEESNLTRSTLFRDRDCGRPKALAAAAALRDLNADTRVIPHAGNVMTDVGLGLFRDADVVIGCLDNREARLWVNRQCWKVSTPWIDGGIQEINGVVKVFVPPASACYECGMTENDYRLINLRYSCPLLRREDIAAGKVPTSPTIASIVGGLQTQEALKLLHGLPVAAGEALVFNGVANQFYRTAFQRREDCLSHETYEEVRELPISAAGTAAELFSAARSLHPSTEPLRLLLDRDLVTETECGQCGERKKVMRPLYSTGIELARCNRCGEIGKPIMQHVVVEGDLLANETLEQLGIPRYDIVRIQVSDREIPLLLAGDRPTVLDPAHSINAADHQGLRENDGVKSTTV